MCWNIPTCVHMLYIYLFILFPKIPFFNYRENTVVISSSKQWNLDVLKEYILQKLEIIRVYTKVRKEKPDFTNPITLTRQRGRNKYTRIKNSS